MAKPRKNDGPGLSPPEHEYWRDNGLDVVCETMLHANHAHLVNADVHFLLTSNPMSRAGRTLAGKAIKPGGLLRHFAQSDFVIVVSDDFWKHASSRQRDALVDHELSHCSISMDKKGKSIQSIVGHDIEEFTDIIQRHGLWHDRLIDFGTAAAEQLQLPLTGKPGD